MRVQNIKNQYNDQRTNFCAWGIKVPKGGYYDSFDAFRALYSSGYKFLSVESTGVSFPQKSDPGIISMDEFANFLKREVPRLYEKAIETMKIKGHELVIFSPEDMDELTQQKYTPLINKIKTADPKGRSTIENMQRMFEETKGEAVAKFLMENK